MRRLTGCSAVAALIFATFYAPFFHVHNGGGETALIHAHLPELETAEDETVAHMERPHSHASARSIDFLTTTGPALIQFYAVIVSSEFVVETVLPSSGFVAPAVPTAHGPPDVAPQIPRAPPA